MVSTVQPGTSRNDPILDRDQTKALYRRLAPIYDFALWGYRLLGVSRHRRQVVEPLRPQRSDPEPGLCEDRTQRFNSQLVPFAG